MPIIRQPISTAEPDTGNNVEEEMSKILKDKVVLVDSFDRLPQKAYILPTDEDLTEMDQSDFWKIKYMENGTMYIYIYNEYRAIYELNDSDIKVAESNFIQFERPSCDRNTEDENEEVVFDLFQNMAQGLTYGNLVGGWKASAAFGKCTIHCNIIMNIAWAFVTLSTVLGI